MNERRATRNMITGVILLGVVIIGGLAALGSIYLVMNLPR
jgi:hypothetical protein